MRAGDGEAWEGTPIAVVYCRSTDGNDADDGSTWALADATLAASLTAAGAGGRSYVSDNHAESTAGAVTLTSPGTAASPTEVVCGDDAAEPPTAVATTATVSTTGANAITFAGFAYCYGVAFQSGSTTNTANLAFTSASPWSWVLDNCTLKLNNTSATSVIAVGTNAGSGDDNELRLINCTLNFGAVGQTIALRAPMFRMEGGSIAGTAPTVLITPTTGISIGIDAVLIGVDLSLLGSGKSLVSVASGVTGEVSFIDCKLGGSVSVTTGTHPGPGGLTVRLVNCDSADTNYRYYLECYQGTISQETVIVMTGGASDGTTAISRKMVSSANTKFYSPLVSDWMVLWDDTPASKTLTIEVVTDNVTLTDAEAWVEVESLNTSGFPLGTLTNDRAANILATPANQTSSSVTWTTTGLATPVKQKLVASFTTAEKGPIRARVCLAKASTTMYFDPKPTVA